MGEICLFPRLFIPLQLYGKVQIAHPRRSITGAGSHIITISWLFGSRECLETVLVNLELRGNEVKTKPDLVCWEIESKSG